MIKIRRLTVGLTAISLLSVGLFGVGSITNPGTAEARCDGRGNQIVSEFFVWTVRVVKERPRAGTCDGDHAYVGEVAKTYHREGAVSVLAQHEQGGPWRVAAWHAFSLNEWGPYEVRDANRNSHVNMRLCASATINEDMICGWADELGGHGDNHGF